VTVAVQADSRADQGDSSMKSVREHMDMNAAYREMGSYRAAAEICGTTPKTVKRSVDAAKRNTARVDAGGVRHNYDGIRELDTEGYEDSLTSRGGDPAASSAQSSLDVLLTGHRCGADVQCVTKEQPRSLRSSR
jgi:hypothetical protein